MAPFGDVASALEVCRVASGGAPADVVRALVLDALAELVAADEVRYVTVDDGVDPSAVTGPGEVHVALPAPDGRRSAVVLLRRRRRFTDEERERVAVLAPVLACALRAATAHRAADAALTARETVVLRSVATGMSDKQAARALGVSPRTVGKHLEHIYAKLGVGGRTEAAARLWAE